MNPKQILHFLTQPRTVDIAGRPFVSQGLSRRVWDDIYHRALTVRWPVFFGLAATIFLMLNTLFAGLYQLGTQSIANQYPHGFAGAFFFSVETLATVGYGDMHPQTSTHISCHGGDLYRHGLHRGGHRVDLLAILAAAREKSSSPTIPSCGSSTASRP
jgi:Ion channel.